VLPAPIKDDELTEEEKKDAKQFEQQTMVGSDMLSSRFAIAHWMCRTPATNR